ncbi:MAG: NAD-dependent epimerase/dehydratase family protein [Pseudomonadota bacterium]
MGSNEMRRLAIVGCGAVVDHHLVLALGRVGWMPTVLIDKSPERIEVVARRMGSKGKAALKGSDWRDFQNDFDAALVAVPHTLHGPIGTELLNAGKHVFMEKPLATTVTECEEMVGIAEANNLILSVGLMRRYLRITRWTKALLEAGILGKITGFKVREGFVFNWDTSTDAILRPGLSGGGVLMDTGAHTLDLLTWWFGPIGRIVSYKDDAEGGVEADCSIECEMASGVLGSVELSRTRDLSDTIRIEGELGFVEVNLSKNQLVGGSENALEFTHDGIDPKSLEPQFAPELFDAELRHFKESVHGGKQLGVGGRDGIESVRMIEQCYANRQSLETPWANLVPSPAEAVSNPIESIPAGSTVLVTGATGFIGGRLTERLLEQGVKVRCTVRNFGHATRIARLGPEMVGVELTDTDKMDEVIKGVDYVIHCAYDMRSQPDNVKALQNIIDSSKKHGVRGLVYVSTFSVYDPFPDGLLTEETRDGDISWIYVRGKLELEKMIFDAVRDEGLPASIVQPTIVYGPYSKPWTDGPAENLIYGTVVLPDRGEGLCNAVYVDDLVDGLVLAATHPQAKGHRFIMSGPEPVTWKTFFDSFSNALGTAKPEYWPAEKISKANSGLMRDLKLIAKNPKMIIQIIVRWYPARQALQAGLDAMPEPLKGFVMKHYFGSGGRKPGEIILPDPQLLGLYSTKAYCDNEKAKSLLGYNPQFDFETGMKPTSRYLEWAFSDLKRTVSGAQESKPTEDLAAAPGAAHAG